MFKTRQAILQRSGREGGALVASLIVVVTLVIVSASVFSIGLSQKKEVSGAANQTRAFYLAEAGVNESLSQIAASVKQSYPVPTDVGTYTSPIEMSAGRFWCDVVDNGDETYTVTSTGAANLGRRTLEAVIAPIGASVFDHAIFAGNTSLDPAYTLRLSGVGIEADTVTGNVYSAGDVLLDEDATVVGDIAATGTITGGTGLEGISRPLPDIAAMNYETNHDFDVASAFLSGAETWGASLTGGNAWQLPEDNPAHIFRKNPDDRVSEITATAKDDFFLEDPYGPLKDWVAWYNGKDGHTITLSGVDGKPGPDGNEKVYYVDGNLWVHAGPFGRIRFYASDGTPIRVTFVVKGNVYFSDDMTVGDPDVDGVAFIAIKDAAEPDSGNVYLGDPIYGTVERVEAFLYAENDFVDFNLDETGSKNVTIVGNMTAGNHVAIDRDFVKADGSVVHSQLAVEFDDRLSTNQIDLPGLPQSANSTSGFGVVFWREIAIQ